jgi:hypothetical protein
MAAGIKMLAAAGKRIIIKGRDLLKTSDFEKARKACSI